MTALTVFAELAFVHIVMAGVTTTEIEPHKFCKKLLLPLFRLSVAHTGMALATSQPLVFAGEAKFRSVMIEFNCRLPFVFIMAFETIPPHLPAMLIEMARETGLIKTEIGAPEIDFGLDFAQVILDKLRLVAIPAFESRMFPSQGESCLCMIEVLFSIRPENHFIFTARMITVAHKADFFFFLDHDKMVSTLKLDPGLYFPMTREALFYARSGAQFMAFDAVHQSFEMCMGRCQLARRNLPPGRQSTCTPYNQNHPNASESHTPALSPYCSTSPIFVHVSACSSRIHLFAVPPTC